MVGALIVRTPEGLEFAIGSGLSDALRQTPPAIGSEITYRYNGYTSNGIPRFARFLRERQPF
jgi:DNA ligase-1